MRPTAMTMLALLLLAPWLGARDSELRLRLEREVREALGLIHRGPGEMVIRDVEFWRGAEGRLREMGALVGDFPLPAESDPLRPPLVDVALRSPSACLALGVGLAQGRAPEVLRGLAVGDPLPGAAEPDPSAAPLLPPGTPILAQRLAGALARLEDSLAALPPPGDAASLRVWLLENVPADRVGAARAAFSAWSGVDDGALLRAALRTLAFGLEESGSEGWPTGEPRRIETERGAVVLGTPGDDVHEEDAWLLVDPGGNDLYRNNAGGARGDRRAALNVDLAGDDRYETDVPFSQGAALCGAGLLLDLEGDDVYVGVEFCQGAAAGGAGLLVDLGGRDAYTADRFAQGAAALGSGLLYDGGGDDAYSIACLGQGLGRVKGLGVLRDASGNDRYRVRPEHESMYSEWTGGRKVHWSFAQGCGFGFYCRYEEERADGQRGLVVREILPGGVGVISDDAGDDVYEGSMYAQGTAYLYGLGILLDRGGDDRYVASWYGQAAAPHFAAGLLVDAAGDDRYEGMHQVQGNGRDFSTAVFLDLAGNDRYSAEDRVQGCGDLNDAWGIFVDLMGDDLYEALRKTARGYATNLDPERQPRPGRPWTDGGVFLDLGGEDAYVGPAGGANRSTWVHRESGRGVGVDR